MGVVPWCCTVVSHILFVGLAVEWRSPVCSLLCVVWGILFVCLAGFAVGGSSGSVPFEQRSHQRGHVRRFGHAGRQQSESHTSAGQVSDPGNSLGDMKMDG